MLHGGTHNDENNFQILFLIEIIKEKKRKLQRHLYEELGPAEVGRIQHTNFYEGMQV